MNEQAPQPPEDDFTVDLDGPIDLPTSVSVLLCCKGTREEYADGMAFPFHHPNCPTLT